MWQAKSLVKSTRWQWVVLLALVLLTVSLLGRGRGESAIVNAQLLTLGNDAETATAMLIRDQTIVAIGDDESVLSQASSAARVIDMQGRTVIPGFVDAHSHFPVSGLSAVSVNIAPPPDGPGVSKAAVLAALEQAVPLRPGNKDEPFVLGFNYDNTVFAEANHPTREELDAISNGYPVYLWHNSGHLGVANSAALERLGIDEDSPPVLGGQRGLDANGRLNGLLLEKAAPSLTSLLKELSWKDQWRIVTKARDEYLAAGVTTVQNGYASDLMRQFLNGLHRIGVLPQRVNTWIAHDKLDPVKRTQYPANTTVKLIVDGSPQGLTAYLSKPFRVPAFGNSNAGFPLYHQGQLNAVILEYHRLGYQLALHGNGDAAIEQIITALSYAQQQVPREDPRHILVHAQLVRPDQLARMPEIGLTPSFFTAHTFYWGDWHRRTLGEQRAAGLSPAMSALEKGLRFSLHADSPVTPMDLVFVMWASTTRTTRTGVVLGEAERLDRVSALRAVTIDAAWQAFQESTVGSLEEGKLADFVVLSENPITAGDIRQVKVEETWIGGQRRYKRDRE